jgi:hypothetical protein
LKLKYVELLSNFADNFNLRRCIKGVVMIIGASDSLDSFLMSGSDALGRTVQVDPR